MTEVEKGPPSSGEVFGTLTTLVGRSKADEASTGGYQLLVLEPSGLAVYPLSESRPMIIGRAEDCDVQLRDAMASRRHATLHVSPLAIEDHASANGTLLGNRAVEPGAAVPVQPGQAISIGSSLIIVRRTEKGEAHRTPADQPKGVSPFDPSRAPIVVHDASMQALYVLVGRIAPSHINVLILGETGVGKELVAETIHRRSPRSEGPVVRINCAALSEALLESELFGHERGAFTGAASAKPGLIEVAHGGTVFLDEVGELPPSLQAKLLRVLEAREVTRVGGLRPRTVDVRFVSATNRDLEGEVARGAFRSDLFFRLNGISLVVPPLRARTSEIVPLAEMFLSRAAEQMSLSPRPTLTRQAIDKMIAHGWPGNVRELRNAIERAALLCTDGLIEPNDLGLGQLVPATTRAPDPGRATVTPAHVTDGTDPPDERQRILEALEGCHGNQTRAAKILGMARRTLVAKLTTYNIPRPRKIDPA